MCQKSAENMMKKLYNLYLRKYPLDISETGLFWKIFFPEKYIEKDCEFFNCEKTI